MMSRVVVFLLTFLYLFARSLIHAGKLSAPDAATLAIMLTCALPPLAPTREIATGQAGNLQCNIDRFTIVGALAAMQGTLTARSVKTAKQAAAPTAILDEC